METLLLIALFVYFVVNAFYAGIVFDETPVIGVIMTFLFGVIIFTVYYACAGLVVVWWLFVNHTGLSFWYHFNYGKPYRNLSYDELYRINRMAQVRFDHNTRAYRVVMKWVKKINERHAYIYSPKEDE